MRLFRELPDQRKCKTRGQEQDQQCRQRVQPPAEKPGETALHGSDLLHGSESIRSLRQRTAPVPGPDQDQGHKYDTFKKKQNCKYRESTTQPETFCFCSAGFELSELITKHRDQEKPEHDEKLYRTGHEHTAGDDPACLG